MSATKVKVRVADCHDWRVENIAPEGSGKIEMSKYATGTVEASGFTVTLRTPARGAARPHGIRNIPNPLNTHIVAIVDEYGDLVDESAFELDFS